MSKKLKTCPFCGAPVRVRSNPLTKGATYICLDPACGADVMFYAGDRRGRDVNDVLWNKRAEAKGVEK